MDGERGRKRGALILGNTWDPLQNALILGKGEEEAIEGKEWVGGGGRSKIDIKR